LLSLESLASL